MGPRAKISPRRVVAAAVIAVAAWTVAIAVPGAAGSAADDLDAVMKDFQADNKITPCLFTSKQLKNAKSQIPADFNIYAPEFKAELNNEIKRWQKRGCSGGTGALRIVKAKGKGGPRSESVTIKNTGATAVNLKGYALRNTARKKLRLTTIRLAKGQTLRVITGCATGKQTASRAGSRHYACKRKQQWKDRADVAELVRRSGGVIGRRRT